LLATLVAFMQVRLDSQEDGPPALTCDGEACREGLSIAAAIISPNTGETFEHVRVARDTAPWLCDRGFDSCVISFS
jgi:hypothetical protein